MIQVEMIKDRTDAAWSVAYMVQFVKGKWHTRRRSSLIILHYGGTTKISWQIQAAAWTWHYSDVTKALRCHISTITSLFVSSTVCRSLQQKPFKLFIAGPLWGESTGDRSLPPYKGLVMRKTFSQHDIILWNKFWLAVFQSMSRNKLYNKAQKQLGDFLCLTLWWLYKLFLVDSTISW